MISVNMDWLGLGIRFETRPDWSVAPSVEGVKAVVLSGTNVWEHRVLIFNEFGDKLATILSSPKSRLMEATAGLIEIANEWLYHGCGWQYIISVAQKIKPFEIVGVSRADICADFVPDKRQQEIICGLSTDEYYVGGKLSGTEFWTHSIANPRLADWTFGKRIPHSQSWGHKTSNSRWKLYYKTKELIDVADKPYIRDQWERCGFDCRNVWRLELSIKHGAQHLVAGRPITYEILNHEWYSILRSFYQQRFSVRRNEGHKDRTNDTKCDLLPEFDVWGYDVRVRPPINELRRNGRITILRKMMKSLEDYDVLMNDVARESIISCASAIIEADQLEEYTEAMLRQSVWEWFEELRVKAYTLCGVQPVEG